MHKYDLPSIGKRQRDHRRQQVDLFEPSAAENELGLLKEAAAVRAEEHGPDEGEQGRGSAFI